MKQNIRNFVKIGNFIADESRKKSSTPKRYKAVIHKIKEN